MLTSVTKVERRHMWGGSGTLEGLHTKGKRSALVEYIFYRAITADPYLWFARLSPPFALALLVRLYLSPSPVRIRPLVARRWVTLAKWHGKICSYLLMNDDVFARELFGITVRSIMLIISVSRSIEQTIIPIFLTTINGTMDAQLFHRDRTSAFV